MPVQIRENKAKHKLERGECVTVISGQNTPDMIDFFGQFGFDAVSIEVEHGPNDFRDIPDITRACDLWDITSLVRISPVDFSPLLYRTLDVGAQGLIVAHVNTAEQARAVVEQSMFHPIGKRGIYAGRQGFGVPDYLERANDETMVVVMIEETTGIKNLSEILEVDHIDVFFIAPGDLAQSMGLLGQTYHPEVLTTIDKAIEQVTAAGKVAGALVTDDTVQDYIKKGARFLYITWPSWLASGAQRFLERVATAPR